MNTEPLPASLVINFCRGQRPLVDCLEKIRAVLEVCDAQRAASHHQRDVRIDPGGSRKAGRYQRPKRKTEGRRKEIGRETLTHGDGSTGRGDGRRYGPREHGE